MCLFPKLVKIKLSNGSVTQMSVPCGKCIECLQLRTHDWELRMRYEQRCSLSSYFITLTYEDAFLPLDGVQVSHMQKFFKRLRKRKINDVPLKFKYYCIGEYGTTTKRPHYHCILFFKNYISINDVYSFVVSSWTKGFVKISPLSAGRIHYCISYLIGQKQIEGLNKQFTCMSKNPAIGIDALKNKTFVLELYKNNFQYTINNGKRVHVPRYYKKKLCNEVVTPIDICLVRCRQCFTHLQKINEYLKERSIKKERCYFFTPSHYVDSCLSNDVVCDFVRYDYSKNSNKDFILKQRNKKLKND